MGRTIVIANQKGGVGKTTTSINLSAALAEQGQKVLVIDMDPQGNTTSGLGVEKDEVENTVYELLLGECTIQECMSAVSKGVGKAIAPMVIILTCMCFFRIVILRILVGIKHEIEMVAIVYPITWVLAGIAMTVNCLIILKKLKNNQLS